MIHIFRKEMKKWHTVLWIVALSMLLSGVGMIFFRQKNVSDMEVASVNGYSITVSEFRRSFLKIQEQINRMRPLAQAYGLSEQALYQTFFGSARPEEIALDMCVKDELVGSIEKNFGVVIDKKLFQDTLIKSLESELPYVIDPSGSINMDTYKRGLENAHLTPATYENQKKDAMKRELIQRFFQLSSYTPGFVAKDLLSVEAQKKSFNVVTFPLKHFIGLAKKVTVGDEQLAAFYNEKKEKYRVGEKRKAVYWVLSPQEYEKNVAVDDQAIVRFYEKNKSSLYRVPPQVKVRHILLNDKETADKVHNQAVKKPDQFAALAKKNSRDEKTAKSGGLVDLFSRGSYDADFEKAAFRLHGALSISPVVKTKEGFQIIQLVKRVKATEKPLDLVREEIEKKLKERKSHQALRSDLEFVLRKMRKDEAALNAFAKEKGLNAQETKFLSEDDSTLKSLESRIARHLFSPKKRTAQYGYFNYEKKSILYKLDGVEKSFIQSLDTVKDAVKEYYYKKQAKKRLEKILAESKASLLDQKSTIEEIAQRHDIPLVSTGTFSKGQKPKSLSDAGGLRDQLPTLTDKAQVLTYKHENDYYLAQVNQTTPADDALARMKNIIKKEKYKTRSIQSAAFIASLHRNAKIEIDSKMLGRR